MIPLRGEGRKNERCHRFGFMGRAIYGLLSDGFEESKTNKGVDNYSYHVSECPWNKYDINWNTIIIRMR